MYCHCIKMEFQKIVNLFDTTFDDKDYQDLLLKNGLKFTINQKKITALTKKLESKHQCWDQIYVILVMHIVVKGEITVTEPNEAKRNKSAVFKNNTPFINCISKIDDVEIDNAVCGKKPRKTTGSLWNYYRYEPSNPFF